MKTVENQEKPLEYESRFIDYEAQFVCAKALKGLIGNGNADSAEDFFDKSLREKYCDGTAGLSYAEFLHKIGNYQWQRSGYFSTEHHLTQALSRAEEAYGDSKHPRVGVALTSIALMYRRKAIHEHSSSLLVQEGLYRKVIDILKVPTTETESEDAAPLVDRSDTAALATGVSLLYSAEGGRTRRREEGK
ncbi:uncharacterized protein LOC114371791 [Glycine soja]|nr:uncharacterized protein LOC114371791 [Glycine soja]